MGDEDLWHGRAGAATVLLALALLLLAVDAVVQGLHHPVHEREAYVLSVGLVLLGLPVAAAAAATPFQRRVFLPVLVGLFTATVALSVTESRLGNRVLEYRDDKVSHLDEVLFEPGVGALAGLTWWALSWWRTGQRGPALGVAGLGLVGIACYLALR